MIFFKRGQSEVVGLLVIVILLLFVGLIFLRFYLLQPATSLESPRASLEAGHILTALMRVSLQDMTLPQHVAGCSTAASACHNLQNELENVFNLILKPGQRYGFSISAEGNGLVSVASSEVCNVGIVSTYSFIEGGIFYDASLILC